MDPAQTNSTERHGVPASELVDTFRVLDGLAEVLGMVVDGQDSSVSNAAAALQSRFAAAEAMLDSLPGGDMTREAQLKEAMRLSSELSRKRKFVAKHRELPFLVEKLRTKQGTCPLEGKEEEKEAKHTVDDLIEEGGLTSDPGNATNGVHSSGDGALDGGTEMNHDFAALERGVGEHFIVTTTSVEDSGAAPSLNTNCLDLDTANDAGALPDAIIDDF